MVAVSNMEFDCICEVNCVVQRGEGTDVDGGSGRSGLWQLQRERRAVDVTWDLGGVDMSQMLLEKAVDMSAVRPGRRWPKEAWSCGSQLD